jgi:hypothetical protein
MFKVAVEDVDRNIASTLDLWRHLEFVPCRLLLHAKATLSNEFDVPENGFSFQVANFGQIRNVLYIALRLNSRIALMMDVNLKNDAEYTLMTGCR